MHRDPERALDDGDLFGVGGLADPGLQRTRRRAAGADLISLIEQVHLWDTLQVRLGRGTVARLRLRLGLRLGRAPLGAAAPFGGLPEALALQIREPALDRAHLELQGQLLGAAGRLGQATGQRGDLRHRRGEQLLLGLHLHVEELGAGLGVVGALPRRVRERLGFRRAGLGGREVAQQSLEIRGGVGANRRRLHAHICNQLHNLKQYNQRMIDNLDARRRLTSAPSRNSASSAIVSRT
ncbi:MAG: hypothetical protein H6739_00905 [Alphaproteobacteria bacterium]|nr:hypothetical protein [Alphaproteobacteria bacterium]